MTPPLSEVMGDRMRKRASEMRREAERLEEEAEGLRNRLRSTTDEARALRLAADLIVQEALELSVPF